MSNNKHKIAIVGSTGIVGRTVLKILEEKSFKIANILYFHQKNLQAPDFLFRSNLHNL